MTTAECDSILDSLCWKYSKIELTLLRKFFISKPFDATNKALQSFVTRYENRFKPPVGALINALSGATSSAECRSYGDTPEYQSMVKRIQSGEVSSLYWTRTERDYPCVVHAGLIYLQEHTKAYPYERLVAPKSLGQTVLVPHDAPLAQDEIPF